MLTATRARRRHLAWLACASFVAISSVAQAQAVIDDKRLQAAAKEDGNWLTFGHDYTNQRFSALKQVDRTNVAKLAPAWIYQFGTVASTQMQPLVADGVMYFPTPQNDIADIVVLTFAADIDRLQFKRRVRDFGHRMIVRVLRHEMRLIG